MPVRNDQSYYKSFYFWERPQNFLFLHGENKKGTVEHSDGIKEKFQKWLIYLLIISDSFVILCYYKCVCDILGHVSSEII